MKLTGVASVVVVGALLGAGLARAAVDESGGTAPPDVTSPTARANSALSSIIGASLASFAVGVGMRIRRRRARQYGATG